MSTPKKAKPAREKQKTILDFAGVSDGLIEIDRLSLWALDERIDKFEKLCERAERAAERIERAASNAEDQADRMSGAARRVAETAEAIDEYSGRRFR